MRQFSNKSARRITWKFCVGIKRYDKPDRLREPAADDHESCVSRTAQQAVQFIELAALAFPAHPYVLLGIPFPCPVQENEAVGVMARVEARNSLQCQSQKLGIMGRMLLRRICPVCQKSKIQLSIGIRQIVDFEPVD